MLVSDRTNAYYYHSHHVLILVLVDVGLGQDECLLLS